MGRPNTRGTIHGLRQECLAQDMETSSRSQRRGFENFGAADRRSGHAVIVAGDDAGLIWWAVEDSNLRPHPCERARHSFRHFPLVLETTRDLGRCPILDRRRSRHFRSFLDVARTSRGPGSAGAAPATEQERGGGEDQACDEQADRDQGGRRVRVAVRGFDLDCRRLRDDLSDDQQA